MSLDSETTQYSVPPMLALASSLASLVPGESSEDDTSVRTIRPRKGRQSIKASLKQSIAFSGQCHYIDPEGWLQSVLGIDSWVSNAPVDTAQTSFVPFSEIYIKCSYFAGLLARLPFVRKAYADRTEVPEVMDVWVLTERFDIEEVNKIFGARLEALEKNPDVTFLVHVFPIDPAGTSVQVPREAQRIL